MRTSLLAVVAIVFIAQVAGAANLLTNGNFETRTDWTIVGNDGNWEGWAAHNGTNGIAMYGWSAGDGITNGSFHQDVTVSGLGSYTYTFEIWVRREANYRTLTNELRLGWYDGSMVQLQADTVVDFSQLPADSQWHHVYVTGSCGNPTLAKVRARVSCAWTNYDNALMFDQAALYTGDYVKANAFLNPGFEATGPGQQRNSGWNCVPELGWDSGGGFCTDWWAVRSGTNAISLYSWDNAKTNYSDRISQNFNVASTGACTFSVWLKREANFLLTNCALSINWYDITFTNTVNDGSVTNLTVPNDGAWHQYFVSSVLTNAAFHEVRVLMDLGWTFNPGADPRSFMMDDTRWQAGVFDGGPVNTEWAYHSAPGTKPSREQVPGTNVGPFLMVDYATHTNTFYVLAENPTFARNAGETEAMRLRTAYQIPGTTDWSEVFTEMTEVGSMILSNSAPFRGQPSSGTHTVALWKCTWEHPRNGGVYYTNNIRVYYAPLMVALSGTTTTDWRYLVMTGGSSNNFGQLVDSTYVSEDYYFDLNPDRHFSLLCGDFETPFSNNFDNTGWNAWGSAGRDSWAARSGGLGGRFGSWSAGSAGIWQDVGTTGGTYTFTLWVKSQFGMTPDGELEVRLEWYDSLYGEIQRDSHSIIDLPRDERWHRVYVTGTCTDPQAHFVRAVVAGNFFDGTNENHSAFEFDDAEFYYGAYTSAVSFQNGGFEIGQPNELISSYWDGVPTAVQYIPVENESSNWWTVPLERPAWAARDSYGYGAAYRGWHTNNASYSATLSQPLGIATGTYTFSAWMLREDAFSLTNAEIRIEWYDVTLTNKVMADSVSNITADLPNDSAWREYWVTATCADTNVFEVRPTILLQWDRNAGAGSKSVKVDDAILRSGTHPADDPLVYDWGYHNAGASGALDEQVPGGGGAFLQVDYATTTTTFYVLANDPTIAARADEEGMVSLRTSWNNPENGAWMNSWTDMTYVGTVEIASGAPFHGSPAAGVQTVALWRAAWTQPMSTNGTTALTNSIEVFYAPYFRTMFGNAEAPGRKYLVRVGNTTNNWANDPQLFDPTYGGLDYIYTNAPGAGGPTEIDGIPVWWLDLYSLGHTNGVGAGDDDDDGDSNADEYAGDTIPNDPDSFFPEVTGTGVGQWNLVVSPSSTGRVYDVWWRTNLLPENVGWTPYGMSVTGNGGAIVLTVTNDALIRFYRTGAHFP